MNTCPCLLNGLENTSLGKLNTRLNELALFKCEAFYLVFQLSRSQFVPFSLITIRLYWLEQGNTMTPGLNYVITTPSGGRYGQLQCEKILQSPTVCNRPLTSFLDDSSCSSSQIQIKFCCCFLSDLNLFNNGRRTAPLT